MKNENGNGLGNANHENGVGFGQQNISDLREELDYALYANNPDLVWSVFTGMTERINALQAQILDLETQNQQLKSTVDRLTGGLENPEDIKVHEFLYKDVTFEFDVGESVLRTQGGEVGLSPQQKDLMSVFARVPGVVIGKNQICRLVWPNDPEDMVGDRLNQLRVVIMHTKQRMNTLIEGFGGSIKSTERKGYKWNVERVEED